MPFVFDAPNRDLAAAIAWDRPPNRLEVCDTNVFSAEAIRQRDENRC
jgi:hypothetical protein